MNEQKYQEVFKKLLESFADDNIVRVAEDKEIFAVVYRVVPLQEVQTYKEEIRQAVLHFYVSKGFKAFLFFATDGMPTLKKKLFDFENNIYVNLCFDNFFHIGDKLKKDEEKPDLLYLASSDTKELYDFLSDIPNKDEQKEVVRNSIKKILNLSTRDAIFFAGEKVVIKKFAEASQKEGNDKPPPGVRRSFDHIPQEQLQRFLKELEKQGLDEKLRQVAIYASQNDLDLKKINPFQFGKSFIKVFQDNIIRLVGGAVQIKEDMPAYTNYVFRVKFDGMLYQLSRELVELLLNKNANAEQFIRFYNGDTSFTPDNKRFQKPDIIDDTGLRWNSSTIFQIAIQRKKCLEKIKEISDEIVAVEDKIREFERKIAEAKKDAEREREKLGNIEKEFRELTANTRRLKDEVGLLKEEFASKKEANEIRVIQEQIATKSYELKKNLKDEELNMLDKKKIENEAERATIKEQQLIKDKVSFERKLAADFSKKENLVENQKPLDEKYEIVLRALGKAISSFRGA